VPTCAGSMRGHGRAFCHPRIHFTR
jgi:hypothetical protein